MSSTEPRSKRREERLVDLRCADADRAETVIIRPARSEDLDAIEHIVDRAYERYVERIGRRPSPMLDDYAIKLRDATVLVAEERGVIGVIVVIAEGDHLLIENVAVEPTHQGRGVGRALLEAAERHAAQLGLGELRLYTNAAMTENLALYPRLGYLQVARRVDDGFDRVYFSKSVSVRRPPPSPSELGGHCEVPAELSLPCATTSSPSTRRASSSAAVSSIQPLNVCRRPSG